MNKQAIFLGAIILVLIGVFSMPFYAANKFQPEKSGRTVTTGGVTINVVCVDNVEYFSSATGSAGSFVLTPHLKTDGNPYICK